MTSPVPCMTSQPLGGAAVVVVVGGAVVEGGTAACMVLGGETATVTVVEPALGAGAGTD